jgi:hypothetical protein
MSIIDSLNKAQDFLNQNNPLTSGQQTQFKKEGFLIPPTYTADGTGLPYNKAPDDRPAQVKRNIITWFVPEFGSVQMFINPQGITYNHRKVISADRTKGGYTLQYWGEELPTLSIQGTTGSSGIEGINMLYEIYRAEQYAFDSSGLAIAAAASNFTDQVLNQITQISGIFGDTSSVPQARNITSLAQLAFTVEMYYNGWVYRGFFRDMTIEERAENFLLSYTINFAVTQKRGYRFNYFPWSRSPKHGYSRDTTPHSYDHGSVTLGDEVSKIVQGRTSYAPPHGYTSNTTSNTATIVKTNTVSGTVLNPNTSITTRTTR